MKHDKSVDGYMAELPADKKAALQRVRDLVSKQIPEAEEAISYGVPAFKYQKRALLYCAAFKNHLSIYPASDEMIEAAGKELAEFRTSKGTLQFTVDKPIPVELLKKIVEFRKKVIDTK